ncbi:TIM barrel protein [Pseudonocardia sp. H11422]|uniref:TIM barrel protein n=1 Tax=Pseudonocardia sp. H11422 TaxID=2835866 RepID=UPI001BDC094B|nr:TIM barrel protein [Pseudonocardia sp. H11422]
MSAPTDLSRLRLGTAPDSWGVWFPDDPHQVPWHQFLDEVARAGYSWIELGPYGYLPTDPAQLRDELDKRGLRLSGGAVFAGLHRGTEALDKAVEDCREEARLLTALGARHLVLLPEQYTDMHSGEATEPGHLEPEQWNDLVTGMNTLARTLHDEFDVDLVFHPHVDTHVDTQERVERFLTDTDPEHVNLCLDTGHISYCGGDNIAIVRRFPDRIGYVHLKQVDPGVLKRVREENLSFADAVRLGSMVEPPYGIPEMPPLLDALGGLGADLFAIVEQDLYPVAPDVPFPIGARTAGYFAGCGVGPVRRWPY